MQILDIGDSTKLDHQALNNSIVNEGAIPLFDTGTLELGTHYHCTPTSYTRDTGRRVGPFLPLLQARHTC